MTWHRSTTTDKFVRALRRSLVKPFPGVAVKSDKKLKSY
jgi:hypothetical protein